MNENLLDRLVKESEISFLSDLRYGCNQNLICKARLSPDEYALEECEKAVGYILKQKRRKFDTASSACLFLRYELEKALSTK